jgi:hypothetical protein
MFAVSFAQIQSLTANPLQSALCRVIQPFPVFVKLKFSLDVTPKYSCGAATTLLFEFQPIPML